MSWLRHGWKSYEPRWFIQRSCSHVGRGWGGQLCLCSTGHVTWWFISAVFLQLFRDGPFRDLLQTLCGKSSKAHKWNAHIKPNNEALCSWAESCSSHWWSPHLPHNFILLAIAPSPPPPSHLYCGISVNRSSLFKSCKLLAWEKCGVKWPPESSHTLELDQVGPLWDFYLISYSLISTAACDEV